ncbi:unnamed protein product [Closterium sp. NIES-54]
MLDFRVPASWGLRITPAMARTTTWPDICALRSLPNRRTLFLTLCDLSLPLVQETLAAPPERQTPRRGFPQADPGTHARRSPPGVLPPAAQPPRAPSLLPLRALLTLPFLLRLRLAPPFPSPLLTSPSLFHPSLPFLPSPSRLAPPLPRSFRPTLHVRPHLLSLEHRQPVVRHLAVRLTQSVHTVPDEHLLGLHPTCSPSLSSVSYSFSLNRGDGEGGREGVEEVGKGGDVHEWGEREEEMQEEDTEGGPLLAMYGGDVGEEDMGEEDRGEEGEEGREDGREEDREEDREDGREGEERGGLFVDDGEGEGATMGDDVWAMGDEEGGDGEGGGRGGGQGGEGEERGEEEDEEEEENEMVMGEDEEDGEYIGRQADETTQTEERGEGHLHLHSHTDTDTHTHMHKHGNYLHTLLGHLSPLTAAADFTAPHPSQPSLAEHTGGLGQIIAATSRQDDRQIDRIRVDNSWGAAGMGQQHDYQYKHFKATVPERQISVGVGNQLRYAPRCCRRYRLPLPLPPPLHLALAVAVAVGVGVAAAVAASAVVAAVSPFLHEARRGSREAVRASIERVYALRVPALICLGASVFAASSRASVDCVYALCHCLWRILVAWFPYSPDFVLKRLVLSGLRDGPHEPLIADSIDFVVSRLDSLSRSELASRLTLNTLPAVLPPLQQMPEQSMTLMDCNDFAAVAWQLRDALYTRYPNATRAFLKSGGDFPFLSRADEVNLHLFLHLRRVDAEREPGHTDILAPTVPVAPAASVASAGDASSGLADSHAHALAAPAGSSAGAGDSAASSFTSAASVFSSSIPSVPHDLPSSSSASLPLSTPAPLEHHASPLASANPFDPLSPPLDPLGLAWQGSPLQPPPALVPVPEGGISGSSLVGEHVPGVTTPAAAASVAAATALTAGAAMLTGPPLSADAAAGSRETIASLAAGRDTLVDSTSPSTTLHSIEALSGTGVGAGLGGEGVGEAVRGVSGSSSDITAGEDDGEEATSAAIQALEGAEGEVISREGTTGGPLGQGAEEGGVREGEEAGGEAGQGNESEEEEEEEESDAAQFRSQASNWLRFVEPEHYGEEEGGSRAEEEGEERGDGVEEVSEGVERLAVGDSPLG